MFSKNLHDSSANKKADALDNKRFLKHNDNPAPDSRKNVKPNRVYPSIKWGKVVYPSTKIIAELIPSVKLMPNIRGDGGKKSCTLPYMLKVNAVQLSM